MVDLREPLEGRRLEQRLDLPVSPYQHSGAMAIEAVLQRHAQELAAAGVEVTPRLVQVLLKLVKEVREKTAIVSQHLHGVRAYCSHLDRLGLTEGDLLAYALVLRRGEDAAP